MGIQAAARVGLSDIDAWIDDQVLVTGSLPPHARDIDLLVRKPEADTIAAALMDRGFSNKGHEWVRFVGCDVEAVDLISAESWDLPEAEERALFADAVPIEGCARVLRPAPHHVLLILARNIARWGGGLTDKRRARLDRALEEDPEAWSAAAARADAWEVAAMLPMLRAVFEGHTPPEGLTRVAPTETDDSQRVGLRTRVRRLFLRQRRGKAQVISFSGIDGSGKTTQIRHLERTLGKLGIEVETVRMRLVWITLYDNPTLEVIARPFKAILGFLGRFKNVEKAPEREVELEDPHLVTTEPDPAREIRERSLFITRAWTTIIGLVYARTQRRAVLGSLRRAKVVICDRYVLDSAAHLRFRYGARTRLRPQIALMRRLLPEPIRAYYVDVPPATALARKAEEYTHAHLEGYTALYRDLYAGLGVIRVDGDRPEEELCAEIAQDVWMSLDP